MGERDTLLTAVLTTPDDDTARLVFADWLEEHGEAAFGRFLRAGVIAAKYRYAGVIDDREFFDAARVLADVCDSGAPGRWVAALGLGPSPAVRGDWLWDTTGDRVTLRAGNTAAVFGRGMLDALTVTLAEWYDAAERAVRSWPVSVTFRVWRSRSVSPTSSPNSEGNRGGGCGRRSPPDHIACVAGRGG